MDILYDATQNKHWFIRHEVVFNFIKTIIGIHSRMCLKKERMAGDGY